MIWTIVAIVVAFNLAVLALGFLRYRNVTRAEQRRHVAAGWLPEQRRPVRERRDVA